MQAAEVQSVVQQNTDLHDRSQVAERIMQERPTPPTTSTHVAQLVGA